MGLSRRIFTKEFKLAAVRRLEQGVLHRQVARAAGSEFLLDNPMTQFSFEWILSLNWLCQKWGQVQTFFSADRSGGSGILIEDVN